MSRFGESGTPSRPEKSRSRSRPRGLESGLTAVLEDVEILPRAKKVHKPEQKPIKHVTSVLRGSELPSSMGSAEREAKLAAVRQVFAQRPGPIERPSAQGVQIGMPVLGDQPSVASASAQGEQQPSYNPIQESEPKPPVQEAPPVVSLKHEDEEAALKKQERDARRAFFQQELKEIDDTEAALRERELAALGAKPTQEALERLSQKQSERKKEALEDLVLNSAMELIRPPTLARELAGQFQDRWIMVDYLAEGGMGKVFEAIDINLRQPAVLKFISTALETGKMSARYFDRFRREAEAMAKINSPYVVKIYDADWSESGAWYAMEKVDGGDLDHQIKERQQFKVREAVTMARDVALGLKAAQEQGVIHRDLKPANILFDAKRGVYKIADFGLAKSIETQNVKLLWLEAIARELLHGQESVEIATLDKTSSQRLEKIVNDIKSDGKAKKAIEESDLGLKKANQDIFNALEELAADIPDFSVHEGFNQLLDAYKQQRVDWVLEQINRTMHGAHIDLYHGQEVSEDVKDKIVAMAVELQDEPKVLEAIRTNAEADFEHLVYRDDVEKMTNLLPEPDIKLSREGQTLGTPQYMAPEQWTGAITTEKADIWALGVVLHQALLNELPFKGKNTMELAKKVLQEQIDPIHHRRPDVPKALSDLISKMLSKKPEDRPSIEEVLSVLESSVQSKPKAGFDPRLPKIGSEDETSLKVEVPVETAPTLKPGLLARIGRFFGRK